MFCVVSEFVSLDAKILYISLFNLENTDMFSSVVVFLV